MSPTDAKAITFRALLPWRAAIVAGLLASALPVASSAVVAGEGGRFSPRCAAHDLKSLAAIEKAGERGDIATSRLAEAGLTFLRGRILCLSGDEARGVATYEDVVSAVTPAERQVSK